MPRKLALLVGVDCYPNFPPKNQLRSCANDARLMAHVLRERFGFAEEGLRLLLDKSATQEGVLAALRDLQAEVRAGDSVVFYFSGHGSQTKDRDGDEPGGEDQTFVPHDSGRREHPNRDIEDDVIYDWVLRVSEVTPDLTVIADTCFSGTVARAASPRPGEKWVEADCRRPASPQLAARRGLRSHRDIGPSGLLPLSDRYVLLAACRVHQSAKELPPIPGEREPYSAFTFFLCQELLRAPADATWRDVIERTRIAAAAAVADQTPQLEGARDRLPFGVERIQPARYLPLETRDGARVRLGGGAVHGVGPGSEWAIYPQGTRRTKEARPLGVVRVCEVRAVSADAEIVREREPLQPGARAFERTKGPGWMRLSVAIDAAGLDRATAIDLGRRLERSPLLRRVEEPAQAEARILVVDRPVGGAEGAVPGLIRVEETSWVVLDGPGELTLPPVAVRQPGSLARLVGDLETRARYLNLLRLMAEEEGNPLHGRLEARFLRGSTDGGFRPALPEEATGEIVYQEGELLALRIVHRAEKPLYIHVLDLGLAGAVDLLHPVAGANEPLAPGHALEIGVRPGQRIRVRIPKAFTAWSQARGGEALEGREFLKIFATTQEADLTWLRQSGFGSAPAGRRPRGGLGSLLWQALGGASRQSAPPAQWEDERWTVVTCAFLVRASRA
jgi:hypothetical protein